jgi:hypothetical protein
MLPPFMKKLLLLAAVAAIGTSLGLAQSGDPLPSFSGRPLQCGTTPVNGTDEVETITIGGTPTAGTFTLTFQGHTTSAITWTAVDATLVANIDAALEALRNIGTGGVVTAAGTVSSGIGTITVTFSGTAVKKLAITTMTYTSSLTGTSPTLAIAKTTPGVTADGRSAAKGTLLIDIAHGTLYTNTGAVGAPTWTLISSAAITVPSAAVADLGSVTSHALTDSTGGSASTSAIADLADGTTYATDHAAIENNFATLTAEHTLVKADVAADRAKLNDLLAKLRTAGIVTP